MAIDFEYDQESVLEYISIGQTLKEVVNHIIKKQK